MTVGLSLAHQPGTGPVGWTRLSLLAAATHSGYELGSGSGLPLVAVLGPYGGAAAWLTGTTALWRVLGREPFPRRTAAVVNGAGLAGVVAHYTSWPSRRTAFGLPWLVTAEGLAPSRMRTYNGILYAWGAASAVGAWRSPGSRTWALVGLAAAPLLARASHREFAWMRRRAITSPAWWNRSPGVRPAGSAGR